MIRQSLKKDFFYSENVHHNSHTFKFMSVFVAHENKTKTTTINRNKS